MINIIDSIIGTQEVLYSTLPFPETGFEEKYTSIKRARNFELTQPNGILHKGHTAILFIQKPRARLPQYACDATAAAHARRGTDYHLQITVNDRRRRTTILSIVANAKYHYRSSRHHTRTLLYQQRARLLIYQIDKLLHHILFKYLWRLGGYGKMRSILIFLTDFASIRFFFCVSRIYQGTDLIDFVQTFNKNNKAHTEQGVKIYI